MALLGAQLVITMVMASFLQKLAPHFSPARWLLSKKLVRYLHPTDDELRSLAGSGGGGRGKRKGHKDRHNDDEKEDNSFMIPKNLEFQLESAKVQPYDLMQLHFYAEFQWLVDFAACTVLVYAVTELYCALIPSNEEPNLSLLWCFLVLAFAIKVLFSVTAIYFRGPESTGERAMCITSGFFFLVLSMGMLVVNENILDFRLETVFARVMEDLGSLARSIGIETGIPKSSIGLRIQLAIFCGFVGTFFTFPGLRLAKMHYDSLKLCADKPFMRMLFHTSFIAPLIVSLLWIKPIARDYFTARIFPGTTSVLMSPDTFDTTRLLIIVGVVLLRIYLMPIYLQSYLNMAHDRVAELRKEAGRISNIDLQRRVARVFYYLCVVALQYMAPLLMCLNFTFLLKTLGEYSWNSYFSDTCVEPELDPHPASFPDVNDTSTLTLESLKQVFTPLFFRGFLGFMTWWVCSVWFATSAIGLIYHSYFVQ